MGNIADSLDYLSATKKKIGNAIVSKGQSVKSTDTFRSYGDKIRAITSGKNVEEVSIDTITSNGTYNPGTDKGYGSVNVSVTPKVQSYGQTVTKNTTIRAGKGIDGYSSITVNVPKKASSGGSKGSSGGSGSGSSTTAPTGLKKKTITENGTYNASDDGAKGYSEVKIAVIKDGADETDTSKKFTVTFKNKGGAVLQTVDDVPYGGAAAYTGEEPTLESMEKIGYWYGWNPIPYGIKKDTECIAQYADFNCGYTDKNEIKDSWDTICKNKGAKYKCGQWKLLCFGDTAYEDMTQDDVTLGNISSSGPNEEQQAKIDANFPFLKSSGNYTYYQDESPHHPVVRYGMTRMMKVSDGGDEGSTSSWVAIDCPYISSSMAGTSFVSWWGGYTPYTQQGYDNSNWERMIPRDFLNDYLILGLPKCLQESIVEVTKYSAGYEYNEGVRGDWNPDLETKDKLWTPSRRELFGDKTTHYRVDYYSEHRDVYWKPEEYETKGPTYSKYITKKILDSMCTTFGKTDNVGICMRSVSENHGVSVLGESAFYWTSYSTNPTYVKGIEAVHYILWAGIRIGLGFCL